MMKAKETNTMRVYCGPSVRGVARQYTSFTGELPEPMKKLVEQHPEVAETRERMERPDIPGQPKTTERVIYELLKAEL